MTIRADISFNDSRIRFDRRNAIVCQSQNITKMQIFECLPPHLFRILLILHLYEKIIIPFDDCRFEMARVKFHSLYFPTFFDDKNQTNAWLYE